MTRTVSSYAALGDSLTHGTDPGREGRWPDAVAGALGCRYANLAKIGATSREVEEEQLDRALVLRPDLVSLICGANDVLESVRPAPGAFAERLARMFLRLRMASPSALIFTATYPDLSRFVDLRERTRRRVARGIEDFNTACRAVAAQHGVLVIEWADHPKTGDPAYRAADGFHPSPEGHRRAATEVLRALGIRSGEEAA
ncbi:MAG TPA: SGNH/GDSL hydrolase family protein [Thermoleophilaceae bacterium]|jgi:lysophospholipase L1-like esterase